jgi:hypothetical protein
VADCRNCKEGKADLEDKACFSGILAAWMGGMAPDSVVLSGTVETQYSGKALEVFNRMSSLGSELERLAHRGPPHGAPKEQAKRCAKCNLSPAKMFKGLGPKLGSDLSEFYLEFRDLAVKASDAEFHDTVCAKCLVLTRDDMGFILDRFEVFVRFVVKEGFKVVL